MQIKTQSRKLFKQLFFHSIYNPCSAADYLIEYCKSPHVIPKIFESELSERLILDRIHPNVPPYSPVVHIGMLFRLYTKISMLSSKLQLTKLFYLMSYVCERVPITDMS